MERTNIHELREIYLLNNKSARKGKKLVDKYLRNGHEQELRYLLRHHTEEGISNDETWLRDHVDYFLEYFSILGLALATGYIDKHDITEVKDDVLRYLNHPDIKRYYYRHYKLEYPQLLLESVQRNYYFSLADKSSITEIQFDAFHALNQSLDNDDVNQFLWFLDGGVNSNSDIDDLKEVLLDLPRAMEMAGKNKKHALNQSVRGFFEYLVFLQEFEELLNSIEDKNIRAAYWYYHIYWFRKIKVRLRSVIRDWHKGLSDYARSLGNPENEEQKSGVIASIEESEQEYLRLFNNVVLNDDYKNSFEAEVANWRRI